MVTRRVRAEEIAQLVGASGSGYEQPKWLSVESAFEGVEPVEGGIAVRMLVTGIVEGVVGTDDNGWYVDVEEEGVQVL